MAAGGYRWTRSRLSDDTCNNLYCRRKPSLCCPLSIFRLGYFDNRGCYNLAGRHTIRLFPGRPDSTRDDSWFADLSELNPVGNLIYVFFEYGGSWITSCHEHQEPNNPMLDGCRCHFNGCSSGLFEITRNFSPHSCGFSRSVDRLAVYLS